MAALAAAWLALAAATGALALQTRGPEDNESPQEMPWFIAANQFHFPQLFATDLEAPAFRSLLQSSPAQYVLVNFYMPWCPHCQHFAPDFERVALAIRNAQGNSSNGILTATMDCVRYASACTAWGIESFPSTLWGRRSDWLARSEGRAPSENLSQIDVNPRTAEAVAQWIQDASGVGLNVAATSRADIAQLLQEKRATLMATALPGAAALKPGPRAAAGADVWDSQMALALMLHNVFASTAFEAGKEDGPKKALLDFVALLARRFPEPSRAAPPGSRCRGSLAALDQQLRSNWTNLAQNLSKLQPWVPRTDLVVITPESLEDSWRLCGIDWNQYRHGFSGCRGSWPGKRGYTCGLWNMFHMLAARAGDETAFSELQTVRDTVAHYFQCADCRDHFLAMPLAQEDITSRRASQLWWWRTHNAVNERVRLLEEQSADGDPAYPKAQWPSAELCPDCRLPAGEAGAAGGARAPSLQESLAAQGWAADRVGAFLDSYYGGAAGGAE